MVHVRLNDREANPNPHINFITPLKMADSAAEEEARQLLRALAAQVRPIMKAEGFVVNSFEEYEHNQVFAGRNWNNGEVVELVLRGAGGGFLPTSWLLSTLCHELAHIKHMNHGPAFQALWAKLRDDVRELQGKGYYGDGYWSSGHRLMDSARMGGQGLDAGDLPEYMCGGAQSRQRPTALRRRRRQVGPSNHTGAQTAKKRKAGSRVTAKNLFTGSGRALNEDAEGEEQKKAGTGFRKKAGSKRAREERAMAAERRLLALQGSSSTPATKEESDDADLDYEDALETDQDRRAAMLDSADKSELDGLKAWQRDYSSDFIFPPLPSSSASAAPDITSAPEGSTGGERLQRQGADSSTIEISSDEDDTPLGGCDMQQLPNGGTAAASSVGPSHPGKSSQKEQPPTISHGSRPGLDAWLQGVDPGQVLSARPKQKQKLSYGGLVQEEVKHRRREALGMDGSGRRLGSEDQGGRSRLLTNSRPTRNMSGSKKDDRVDSSQSTHVDAAWTCGVCTLVNEPLHLACSACATARGGTVWSGDPV
ncbi:WLM domain-containing protein [Earliella scabrosa]|nr:WLM domain-containing protein [Earliella scabrosa]